MRTDKLGRQYIFHGQAKTPPTPEQRILTRFKQTAWLGMNQRTVNGSCPAWNERAKQKYLKRGLTLDFSKEQFYAWCDQNAETILTLKKSNERPSIDRIDDERGYSLENIRILSLGENCRLGSAKGKAKMKETVCRPIIAVDMKTKECRLVFVSAGSVPHARRWDGDDLAVVLGTLYLESRRSGTLAFVYAP